MKLWFRKRALMLFRAILWRADEWLHHKEIALREELVLHNAVHSSGRREVAGRAELRNAANPVRSFGAGSSKSVERPTRPEPQWITGIVREHDLKLVVGKKPARRRGMTAAEFDARIGR